MSFKPGAQKTNQGEMKVSGTNRGSSGDAVSFKAHVNPRMTLFDKSPRGLSRDSLQESMRDVSVVTNFLKPKANINRYKAFPMFTESM